jgi:hypothetical protein
MSRADAVLFRWLRDRWARRRSRVVWRTEQSSVIDKWWSLLNENVRQTKVSRDFGHPGEEIRTKDWCWSWVTAWLAVLNVWRYILLLLLLPVFGRFVNASIKKFPWRALPKYFKFLHPQRIFISALHYLLQFKGSWRYSCLHDFSCRDTQCPLVVKST